MRVRIDEHTRICPEGHYMELQAGEVVSGPLAEWLATVSGCAVTVLEDEPAVTEETPEDETPEDPTGDGGEESESETDGSLSADLTAASEAAAETKPTTAKSTKAK